MTATNASIAIGNTGLAHTLIDEAHMYMANTEEYSAEATKLDTTSYLAFVKSAPFAATDRVCVPFSRAVECLDTKFVELLKGTYFEGGMVSAFARGVLLTISALLRAALFATIFVAVAVAACLVGIGVAAHNAYNNYPVDCLGSKYDLL
ncbi:MAG: hypothetical protein HYX48_05370 [Chlamydiales bacterium]|nr:hypothetical protein [Chlamydiales bacterium]